MATMPSPPSPPKPKQPPPPRSTTSNAPALIPAVSQGWSNEDQAGRGLALVLNGVEGWGKTSLGAFAPDSAFIMAPREEGYHTLRTAERVPKRPWVTPQTWDGVLDAVRSVPSSCHVLVMDALGGFERLCHEFVCTRDFKGDWGEKGFSGFQRGFDVSVAEWLRLFPLLDEKRKDGTTVLMLSHAKVKPFKNPLGPDYDRYAPDCHDKTWGVTHKWADAVLFGTFVDVVLEEKKGRPKGVGSTQRIMYTERSAAYDAKNRFGMAPDLEMPDDPAKCWETLMNAIGGKR